MDPTTITVYHLYPPLRECMGGCDLLTKSYVFTVLRFDRY